MKKTIILALAIVLSCEVDAFAQGTSPKKTTPPNPQIQNNTKVSVEYEADKSDISDNRGQTSGSYVGLDLIATKTCFLVHDTTNGTTSSSYPPANCGSSNAVGASYKYAFNYQGLFIAPGAFFEYYVSEPVEGRNGVSLDNQKRYGLRVDVGYDLTKKFSPYVTSGYARIDYRTRSRGDGLTPDPNGPNGYQSLTVGSDGDTNRPFWGVGLKYDFTKNLSGNLEYQRQNYKAKAAVPAESSDYLSNINFTTKLDIFRAGISYHF